MRSCELKVNLSLNVLTKKVSYKKKSVITVAQGGKATSLFLLRLKGFTYVSNTYRNR